MNRFFAVFAALWPRRSKQVEDAKTAITEAIDDVFDAAEARFDERCDRFAQRFGGARDADDLLLGFDGDPNGDAIDAEVQPPEDWNELRAYARERGVRTHGKNRQQLLRALARR